MAYSFLELAADVLVSASAPLTYQQSVGWATRLPMLQKSKM